MFSLMFGKLISPAKQHPTASHFLCQILIFLCRLRSRDYVLHSCGGTELLFFPGGVCCVLLETSEAVSIKDCSSAAGCKLIEGGNFLSVAIDTNTRTFFCGNYAVIILQCNSSNIPTYLAVCLSFTTLSSPFIIPLLKIPFIRFGMLYIIKTNNDILPLSYRNIFKSLLEYHIQ